ncbi:MAG: methyl-accepting chemotaxis protein, partial [Desulfuromonadales bacterium]
DETGMLQQSMAKMMAAIRLMIVDTTALAGAAAAGSLATRADATKHQGEFSIIVKGINETLDAVINPINEVRSIMEAMANGELSRRMTGDVQGDFAALKESLNNTMATLSVAIGNVTHNARQVASASAQTSGAVSQISDGSQKQFHAIVQVAVAVKQTAASIADISRNTEAASQRAKNSVTVVAEGQIKMANMVEVVNNIATNSEKINKFTDVIEKIATKTNMLSLNAAIEAARAGEHGRGFAVVADEVGKLAASAAESTHEIVALVTKAVLQANIAVSTVKEISSDMRRISDDTLQTESMLLRISTALEEQSSAVQEINANITSLNRVAESNAAASEEITATVIELARLADNTRKEAERFRL